MRDALLHKCLPALLVALALALPALAFATTIGASDSGPLPAQTSDHGSVTVGEHGDAASSGISQGEYASFRIAGPYYFYSTAVDVADRLERLGFDTEIRLVDGLWYVIYW